MTYVPKHAKGSTPQATGDVAPPRPEVDELSDILSTLVPDPLFDPVSDPLPNPVPDAQLDSQPDSRLALIPQLEPDPTSEPDPVLEPDLQPDPQLDSSLIKIKRRRWPITIAIILAIIIISGVTTYYILYNQAMEREANRAQGYVILDQAIALIQESDPEVIGIDAAVKSEVTQADLPQRQVLLDKIPTTQPTLENAAQNATKALDLFSSANDKALAQRVIDAANNRIEMLRAGRVIIEADIKAMNSAVSFGQAWDIIIAADADMRAAAELSRSGSYYDALQAIEANKAVFDKLNQATDLITQAKNAFFTADFGTVMTYLTLKKQSLQLAIESDEALVDADLATAQRKNQEFAETDALVVAEAAKIPSEPLSLITTAYDKVTAQMRELFGSARANATDADVFIREYVGVETQTAVQ